MKRAERDWAPAVACAQPRVRVIARSGNSAHQHIEEMHAGAAAAEAVLRPADARRQGGENRLDVASGPQAEGRAAVIEEVEFDVAPAPDQLLVALRLAEPFAEVGAHELWIDGKEGTPDLEGEGQRRFDRRGAGKIGIGGGEVVEEDAADAAR